MWAGIERENKKKEKQEYRERLKSIKQQIDAHFSEDYLEHPAVEQILPLEVADVIGIDVILDVGFCEYCIKYEGISSTVRKIHNIPVINSYCYENLIAVKPTDRCRFFVPNAFWQKVIKAKIKKKVYTYYKGNIPERINRLLNPNYDEDY